MGFPDARGLTTDRLSCCGPHLSHLVCSYWCSQPLRYVLGLAIPMDTLYVTVKQIIEALGGSSRHHVLRIDAAVLAAQF